MKIDELHVGAEVFWNDPDDGICSGMFKVTKIISDDIIQLQNDEGSVIEAFVSEVK